MTQWRACRRSFVVLILVLCPSLCFSWEGRVTEVVRADELRVLHQGSVEKVRLYGIDAPIDPQPFGKEALFYTMRRVLGRTVEVQPLIRDHLDRIIAWVWIDGESLNREMLRSGIAWWYKKYLPFEKELEILEAEARKANVGLWAKPNPIPPWEFQGLPTSEPGGPEIEGLIGRRGMAAERMREQAGISGRVNVREGLLRRALQQHMEDLREKYGTKGDATSTVPELPRSVP